MFVEYSILVWNLRMLLQRSIGLEGLGGKVPVTRESAWVHSPDTFAVNNMKESNRSSAFSSHGWSYKDSVIYISYIVKYELLSLVSLP